MGRAGILAADPFGEVRHEVPIERLGPIASYSAADTAALQQRSFTVAHVPLAFDPTMTPTQLRQTDEVVFVGARYPARERLLVGLADAGVPVRAYGRDWSGHLVDRVRDGRMRPEQFEDLGEIIQGKTPGRQNDDEIFIYSVGGMPVEDVAWATKVYRNAVRDGIGTTLKLWDEPTLA